MLEGELTAGVLPTLLRDLYVGRRTGLLYLRNGGVERCVRFREGRIVGASSSAALQLCDPSAKCEAVARPRMKGGAVQGGRWQGQCLHLFGAFSERVFPIRTGILAF